jgi:hypothetical protein
VRLVRVKMEFLVVLDGDLKKGLPWIDADALVKDGAGALPDVQAVLPGGRAELSLMVASADGKIRPARLRDFCLEES